MSDPCLHCKGRGSLDSGSVHGGTRTCVACDGSGENRCLSKEHAEIERRWAEITRGFEEREGARLTAELGRLRSQVSFARATLVGLAGRDPVILHPDGRAQCTLCLASDAALHDDDCPWADAVEWIAAAGGST